MLRAHTAHTYNRSTIVFWLLRTRSSDNQYISHLVFHHISNGAASPETGPSFSNCFFQRAETATRCGWWQSKGNGWTATGAMIGRVRLSGFYYGLLEGCACEAAKGWSTCVDEQGAVA